MEECLITGVEAEKIGADAASELLRNIDDGGCVDDFLQDQVNNLHNCASTSLCALVISDAISGILFY